VLLVTNKQTVCWKKMTIEFLRKKLDMTQKQIRGANQAFFGFIRKPRLTRSVTSFGQLIYITAKFKRLQ